MADDTVGLHTLDEGIPTGYMVSFGGGKKFNVGLSDGIELSKNMDIIIETTFKIAADGSQPADFGNWSAVVQ